jgi:dynein heavy chain
MPIGWGLEVQMTWAKAEFEGTVPARRAGHSLSIIQKADDSSAVVLFGGCDGAPTNETWMFEDGEWNEVAGDAPPVRWRHSASVFDGDKVLVFGGFDQASRLNDAWVFDGSKKIWEQISATQDGDRPPFPRGGHSASVVPKKEGDTPSDVVYVFGGYGGTGFGRKDFKDITSLKTDSWEWKKVPVSGEEPEPRSDHAACVVRSKIYVTGGWSASAQFDDTWIFETQTSTWTKIETAKLEVPRWQHSMVAVWAVPNWKIFMFGGESGDLEEDGLPSGTYLNDATVLDTGDHTWGDATLIGEAPLARSDTEMVFQKDKQKLMFVGGWAHDE